MEMGMWQGMGKEVTGLQLGTSRIYFLTLIYSGWGFEHEFPRFQAGVLTARLVWKHELLDNILIDAYVSPLSLDRAAYSDQISFD